MPDSPEESWRLYRALVNIRMPGDIPDGFLPLQDEMLQAMLAERGAVDGMALPVAPSDARLSVWQGDTTRLSVDAIVNAANEQLLGCFIPGHSCVDNAIHTYAGIQLREACHTLMQAQRHEEPVGRAKVTPGFNLPSGHVFHTVGPTVEGALTHRERAQLAACYHSCLSLAAQRGLRSVAFCCISTGLYRFPKLEAAQIAIQTARSYLDSQPTAIQRVIFNVYEEGDHRIYRALLGFD